ncbi:divergent polysaccharide deacetylase family protein [Teredinibacter turnerae]|uniref:divergent polysaccharide deacetylase family protein n=1 Tax=Teredinibacter turnerae TaxID=2426 RepID=UPI00048D9ED9|nr:divergent polysaccharide deacetylase family protein [Teredinibacter turnerae]
MQVSLHLPPCLQPGAGLLLRTLLIGLAWLTETAHAQSPSQAQLLANAPEVAIIIDDLGYKRKLGTEILALPWPLTAAIIPFTPYATTLAESAHVAGKEVMVHAPMEPVAPRPWEQGLAISQDETEFRERCGAMLDAVPYAVGLNNHGGSRLTASSDHMHWLMAELDAKRFYFIDSRTSADSIAEDIAQTMGLATASRNVFLDNTRDPEAILAQLGKLETIARQHGYAIGIGHPYPETLQALQLGLGAMANRGITLVPVSRLLAQKSAARQLADSTAHPR